MVDRQLGVTWRAPRAEIDLTRRPEGGVEGTAELSLALGEQQARLTLSATLAAGASETHLRARLSPVTPRVIARAAPSLAALAALDAPVGGEATLDLDAGLALRDGAVRVCTPAPARCGSAAATCRSSMRRWSRPARPDAITVQVLRVSLRGHDGGPVTHLEARGTAQRDRTGSVPICRSISIRWISPIWRGCGRRESAAVRGTGCVANIPAGIARNGHVDLGLAASPRSFVGRN